MVRDSRSYGSGRIDAKRLRRWRWKPSLCGDKNIKLIERFCSSWAGELNGMLEFCGPKPKPTQWLNQPKQSPLGGPLTWSDPLLWPDPGYLIFIPNPKQNLSFLSLFSSIFRRLLSLFHSLISLMAISSPFSHRWLWWLSKAKPMAFGKPPKTSPLISVQYTIKGVLVCFVKNTVTFVFFS